MGEYGRIVGEGSGAVSGGGSSKGGGSGDLGSEAMGAFSDLVDQVGALPAELVIVVVAVVLISGIFMSLRPS